MVRPEPNDPWLADVLEDLVRRSWLRPQGDGWFDLLLTVRGFAGAQLSSPAREAAEQRHGSHYAGLGTPAAILGLRVQGGRRRHEELVRHLDNCTAAARRAREREDGAVAADCALAAWEAVAGQGPFGDGAALL